MESLVEEPTPLDNILYYCLFLGAIFQMVCIAAVIFIPQSKTEEDVELEEPNPDPKATPATQSIKKGKREKKKHR